MTPQPSLPSVRLFKAQLEMGHPMAVDWMMPVRLIGNHKGLRLFALNPLDRPSTLLVTFNFKPLRIRPVHSIPSRIYQHLSSEACFLKPGATIRMTVLLSA